MEVVSLHIKLEWRRGLKHFLVELDSLMASQLLSGDSDSTNLCHALVQQIKLMVQ